MQEQLNETKKLIAELNQIESKLSQMKRPDWEDSANVRYMNTILKSAVEAAKNSFSLTLAA